jgi:hypothetical protein
MSVAQLVIHIPKFNRCSFPITNESRHIMMNILKQHDAHVKSPLSDQRGRTSLAFINIMCNGNLGQLDDASNNHIPTGITEVSLSKL